RTRTKMKARTSGAHSGTAPGQATRPGEAFGVRQASGALAFSARAHKPYGASSQKRQRAGALHDADASLDNSTAWLSGGAVSECTRTSADLRPVPAFIRFRFLLR